MQRKAGVVLPLFSGSAVSIFIYFSMKRLAALVFALVPVSLACGQ